MEAARAITQRELRNESGKIMNGLDRGETFVVTRNGVPVGELRPLRRRTFVPPEVALAAFAGTPRSGGRPSSNVRRRRSTRCRSTSGRRSRTAGSMRPSARRVSRREAAVPST